MNGSLDITARQRNEITALLSRYLPGVEIWAFGSRVKWSTRPDSDLDLVAFTRPEQKARIAELGEAFAESSLPFRVDLHVWRELPQSFRKNIEAEYVVLQEAGPTWRRLGVAGEDALQEGWQVLKLGDLGKIVTGKTPSTKIVDNFGGYIPFITPSDMDGRRIIAHTARYLTEQGAASVSSGRIPKGAVMVSCIGSDMGKAAITGCDAVTNQQINSIIVGEGISNLYVYYNLSIRKSEIQHIGSGGSAVPILNKGHFSQLRIALPPLAEQQAIAHILGTLDDKIELNRRMNQTLEEMARAIFKSWFVDFDPVRAKAQRQDAEAQRRKETQGQDSFASLRLGGSALNPAIADLFPDGFEESELGEIPKGWRVGSLGEVADNPRRSVQPDRIEPSSSYIGLEHMPRRCIALSEWGHADELESNKFEFKCGEILFGKLRPYFHKVGVAPVDGVCSTDILVVVPKEVSWFGFVLGHISSVEFINHTDATSTGTKMPRTNWQDMARYEIALPPKSVATAFNDSIRPLIERIMANIHEARTLAALRDTLLPKLISGELRIPDAEKLVEAAL